MSSRTGLGVVAVLIALLAPGCGKESVDSAPPAGVEHGHELSTAIHQKWDATYDGVDADSAPRLRVAKVKTPPWTRPFEVSSYSVLPCPQARQKSGLRLRDFAEQLLSDADNGVHAHVALLVLGSSDEAAAAAKQFRALATTCPRGTSARPWTGTSDTQGEYIDWSTSTTYTEKGADEVIARTEYRVVIDGPSLIVLDGIQRGHDAEEGWALIRVADRLSVWASEAAQTLYDP